MESLAMKQYRNALITLIASAAPSLMDFDPVVLDLSEVLE